MFIIERTAIDGCVILLPAVRGDSRGRFVKTVHADFFADHGLESGFIEQYYSVSAPGVLRGMHFQLPPHDHAKLVYCVQGHALDVVVDVRRGSPTYGQHVRIDLDADSGRIVHIGRGLAHGFFIPTVETTLVYNVTSLYAPDADSGIRWDSAGIDWPTANPLMSPRDAGLPPLPQFDSPFT